MIKINYSKQADKDLEKLDSLTREKIIKKIYYFSKQEKFLKFAKQLSGYKNKRYRFRIGHYRAVFRIDKKGQIKILLILKIKHRKEIYR